MKLDYQIVKNVVVVKNLGEETKFYIEPLGFDVNIKSGDTIQLFLFPEGAIDDLEVQSEGGFLYVHIPFPYDKLEIHKNGEYVESL